jgi:hypothetical protein
MRTLLILLFSTILVSSQCQTTWSEHVAPILYNHCTTCHHDGGIGPSSFVGYNQAVNSSGSILSAILEGSMPPWPANPAYRAFAHQNVLTSAEKTAISDWVMNGTPSGDLGLAPADPVYNNSSQLSTISLSVQTPDYTSTATSSDVYRTFVVPSNYSADQFIEQLEVIPGNPSIVHHVVIYYDPTNDCLTYDANDPGPGFTTSGTGGALPPSAHFVGVWAPGKNVQSLPNGFGIRAEANGYYLIEIHYPAGSVGQNDQTTINIQHSNLQAPREVWLNPVLTHDPTTLVEPFLYVPANQSTTFHSVYNLNSHVTLFGIMPHMHLIGRTMTCFGTNGNDTIPLIQIPSWNFHWQLGYDYNHPLHLTPGTQLQAVALYDNTTNNPWNPANPPVNVVAGEATTNEMLVVFFMYALYQNGDENIVIDPNLSIENQHVEKPELMVYPNPALDKVQWSSFSNRYEKGKMSLTDINGKTVQAQFISIQGGMNQGELDVSHLAPGVYQLTLEFGNQHQVTRLIKE